MRDPLKEKFKAIFNLFTSFGYFENEETNARVLKNFKNALLDEGCLVIDFLNLYKVREELVPRQEIVKGPVRYKIEKSITENFIIKDIEVNDRGSVFNFQEKVQALDLQKFERYSSDAGLKIKKVFGDYDLGNYSEKDSERLILVFK